MIGWRLGLLSAIAWIVLCSQIALAQSSSSALDFTVYQPFVSARALGMGNAFTAVADDYSALFYNPAGLARLKASETNLEVRAMIDGQVLPFENQIAGINSSTPESTIANELQSDYGNHYSARLPTIGGYYVRPHWGIAVIPVDLSLEASVNQLVGPAAQIVAYQDSTVAFGYGWNPHWFQDDQVSLGFTLKGVYRAYYNQQITALQLAVSNNLLSASAAREGLTGDADFGFLYTPKPPQHGFFAVFRPTLGFAIRNILDYGFPTNYHLIDQKTSDYPPFLQRRFDFGSSFELPDWWVWHSHFTFDVRDVGYSTFSLRKGTHVGLEFLWKIRSWFNGGWRAGFNQGYWTAGFSGKFAIFQLDVASYGEEVGPDNLPQVNRRYMAKASLDW